MEKAVSSRSAVEQEGIVILAAGNENPTDGPIICCVNAVSWFW